MWDEEEACTRRVGFKALLIEMAKLIQSNRKISEELAMALTHMTYIRRKLKLTNYVMATYIRILLHSDLLWKKQLNIMLSVYSENLYLIYIFLSRFWWEHCLCRVTEENLE